MSVSLVQVAPVAAPVAETSSAQKPSQVNTTESARAEIAERVVTNKPHLNVDPAKSAERLSEVIEDLNQRIESLGRNLGFRIDDKVNRSIVTVVNRDTGEVVRQIPTEVVIRVAHSIEDLKGLLFDTEF